MDQIHNRTIHAGNQCYRIDFRWIGAGFILSIISGWFLPELFISDPAIFQRGIGLVLLPTGLATGVALLELVRSWSTSDPADNLRSRRLYPLGSVASGYELPPTPGTELRREALAPAGVLLTASLLTGLGLLLEPGSTARIIFLTAGTSHLAVAVLNVLPGMPFTGGSALRAIFWYLHGRHSSGTRAAFLYGQFLAAVSLGFGIYFLTWHIEAVIPGLWSLFLGWMVIRASTSELQRSRIIERAGTICAADALEGLNPTLRASAPLTEGIDILMEQRSNGPGLVRDRSEYAGMLNLNLVRQIPRQKWEELTVMDATIPFDTLTESDPGTSLLNVFQLLPDDEPETIIVRHENGRISGLVDGSIDPRLLLRRGLMRNFDSVGSKQSSHKGPTTS